ncbi:hypothetical protein H1R20_g1441, partial [Candolleomyces eurysporus]
MLGEGVDGGSDCDEESGSDAEGPPYFEDQETDSVNEAERKAERNLNANKDLNSAQAKGKVAEKVLKLPSGNLEAELLDPEFIATSIPAAPIDDAFADPDGHCAWITSPEAKAKYPANKKTGLNPSPNFHWQQIGPVLVERP